MFICCLTHDADLQISNEEAKALEISKLQKNMESLNLKLDEAKLATVNECQKNAVLLSQLDASQKEKTYLERELAALDELRKENAALKVRVCSQRNLYSLFH